MHLTAGCTVPETGYDYYKGHKVAKLCQISGEILENGDPRRKLGAAMKFHRKIVLVGNYAKPFRSKDFMDGVC